MRWSVLIMCEKLSAPPATGSPEDIESARKANFGVTREDLWVSGIWQDPVYLGSYPEEFYRVFAAELPRIGQDDLKTIAQPLDFIGLNIYRGRKIKAGKDGGPVNVGLAAGYPRTGFDWTINPESLYWGPKFFYERYRRPVIVTENGIVYPPFDINLRRAVEGTLTSS